MQKDVLIKNDNQGGMGETFKYQDKNGNLFFTKRITYESAYWAQKEFFINTKFGNNQQAQSKIEDQITLALQVKAKKLGINFDNALLDDEEIDNIKKPVHKDFANSLSAEDVKVIEYNAKLHYENQKYFLLQDNTIIRTCNLLGMKTPNEIAIMKSGKALAQHHKDSDKFEYDIMVKRAIASGEPNKNISGNEHEKNDPNKQIDVKHTIRNQVISMVLNLVDTRISNNHNTLPINYKEKEGKGDKFINYDPNFYFGTANDPNAQCYKKNLVNSEKLSQNLNAENFFASLKAVALGQDDLVPENAVYFNNSKEYFGDIDTNTDKQKEIAQVLQKIPYKYEQNKDRIKEVISDFRQQGGDFKSKSLILADCWFPDGAYGKQEVSINQIADNLEGKINKLQLVTKELGKKFAVAGYKETGFFNPNKYQAQKLEPALTNEVLADIHKKLGGDDFSKSNVAIYSQKQEEVKQTSFMQKIEQKVEAKLKQPIFNGENLKSDRERSSSVISIKSSDSIQSHSTRQSSVDRLKEQRAKEGKQSKGKK